MKRFLFIYILLTGGFVWAQPFTPNAYITISYSVPSFPESYKCTGSWVLGETEQVAVKY